MKSGSFKKTVCMVTMTWLLVNTIGSLPVQAATNELSSDSKFITVDSKEMHIVLYGDLDENGVAFAD